MAAFLGAESLGLYAVAVAWSSAVAPLLNGIGLVMLPQVAASMNRGHAVRFFAEGVRMTSTLAACSCVGLALITPPAIHVLFGAGFSGSIPSALILVPGAGILGINLALQEGLRALGYPYAVLKAELSGLVVTAVALAMMLRPLGIGGAACASLFGYSTVTISLLTSAKRIAGISPLSLILPRSNDIKNTFHRISAIARSTATGSYQ
jgi:O-antigen/teichoic acid export membrane protein